MEEADVVAAFLIGLDQAAAKGRPVFLYPPSEWDLQEWLKGKSAELKNYFHGASKKDIVWRQDGNLYGRRTAGATYRAELEELLTIHIQSRGYKFQTGTKDPCVYRCSQSSVRLLHHVDDIRSTGPPQALETLVHVVLPTFLEVKYSGLCTLELRSRA